MKLISRLFRGEPPPAPPTPPTLEERIDRLNGESPEGILAAALNESEEALRIAAVQRLNDAQALRRMAGVEGSTDSGTITFPASLKRAAQSRLAQLIDEGSVDAASPGAAAAAQSAHLSVMALCKDTTRLPQALACLADPVQIAQLVADSPSSRVRQLAAEMIDDPVQIRQLLKQIRTKDKVVYKILKQKCDALNAQERAAAEIAAETEALCASIERHSQRSHDVHYASTVAHLQARWQAISPRPDAAMEQRALQALEACGTVIAGHARLLADQAERHAAQQALEDARNRERQAAQEAAATQAAAEEQRRAELAALRTEEEKILAEKQAAEDHRLRQIGGLIRKSQGALSEGNTQMAAGLRRAIAEKVSAESPLPVHLLRGLQQLDDKLNELKQWKDYAVTPKRAALIQEMESLIGSTEEPQTLADRIKALQQDWRTISKGLVSDPPEDWDRFHQASQAAYQPCREYFEAQAKLRLANLQNRQALLERVISFESAQNAANWDMRLLMRVLREAPQEWRRHFPVERESGRAVQAEFDTVIGRLQSRLDAWHAGNAGEKQSLIKRSRHLLTLDDGREAIDALKRLQMLWKETGPAPREQEQSLWSEFREVCDAVFQKRQQAHADYAAGLEAAKSKAVNLCEQIEAVTALPAAELPAAAANVEQWRTDFESLDELPRGDARALRDRFERARRLFAAQMAQQRERDAQQSFADLFEAARQLQAYGWSVIQNEQESQIALRKQAAEAFIAGVPQWPKRTLPVIKEALAKVVSWSSAGVAEREQALRMLCICGEIHAEITTPPEDEALRREYQVQRLMRSMGQGAAAQDGDWETMALEWIRSGPVTPAVYEPLLKRFMLCRPVR